MLLKFWNALVVKTLMDKCINVCNTMPKCGIYDYKNPIVCALYD
jgi:hypothetical protein